MSISLDIALFLRNSKTKLGLSLSNRGLLYTLAFRVGTKAATWVSPEALADECGIQRQNIFEPLEKIEMTGLIKKKPNSKDRRKKLYSFSNDIKNYHLMSEAEREKVHAIFNDVYMRTDYKQSGKPDLNTGEKSGKPDNESLENQTEIECANRLEPYQPCDLAENAQIPKGTMKATIKAKEHISCASDNAHKGFEKFWLLYPRKTDKLRAQKLWIKNKLHENENDIIDDLVKRNATEWKEKDRQYIPYPSTYLNGKRWNDEILPTQQQKGHNNGNQAQPRQQSHNQRIFQHTVKMHLEATGRILKDKESAGELDYNPLSPI